MKKNLRVGLLLVVFIIGCATTSEPKKEAPPEATAPQMKEFKEAEALYKKRKTAPALKKFLAYIQHYPASEYTDDAQYYSGHIYYEQGDFAHAAKYWLAVADSKLASQYYDHALVGAAQAENQLGRTDDALATIKRFKIKDGTDKGLALQGLELSSRLKLQKGQNVEGVRDLLTLSDIKTNPPEKQAALTRAGDVVMANFSQNQLEEILGKQEFDRVEAQSRFRLGVLLYEQRSFGAAHKQFESVAGKFSGTEISKRAQQYLTAIDAQERTDTNVVGVVLPLSGKYSQMGYKTLRGIQMAFGVFNKNSTSPVKLAIIDSEGNPDIARRGVERLVSEDHVVVIIGDILSKTAQAVAVKAQELGIPCVTLAQKQGLTEIGDFIFRSTLTPDIQMRTLVDQAMTQRGYKKFAIVFPNDSYGTEYATAFWDHVLLRGGEVTAAQTYRPDETDFRDVIQKLVGTYYSEEDRGRELALRLADWKKQQTSKSAREKPPRDLLPPAVDFDAIFIPDSPKAIGQIAPMLAYNDVDKIPLMGTNLWNTSQIVARGTKFVENSLFIDEFFPDDTSPAMRKFVTDFTNQFGYKPDVFEAQGFDSASIVNSIMRDSSYSLPRVALRERLATATNIAGSTGPLKISAQKEVEKSLVSLTIQKGQIVKSETGRGAAQ